MRNDTRRLAAWWQRWGALFQAGLFVLFFFTLSVLKHDSFHTRALDLAKFDQAIWNTLRGRFLFSTMQNQSILANHFSPFMAFLAPLFWIWNDVRVLFLVQIVGLAAAGLFLYQIVRSKHERIAPWFLLVFYLNPALHEVALVEFRRVTLAVPFLAMALYALYAKKRGLMAAGLALALLCKENMALIVFMVGLVLILFERDWKWGVLWAVVGAVWAVAITFWVIPQFALQVDAADSLYSQLNYFGLAGDSYGEILQSVLRDPFVFLRHMFDGPALEALWRVFLPLGLVVPFVAPRWMLIVLPSIALMLMSTSPGMHRLEDWYSASVLPGLFAAAAIVLTRLSEQRARLVIVGLMCTTVVGYALFSHAPLGAEYDPVLYRVTDHHRLAEQAVAAIPAGTSVSTQDPYVPHLSHREHIYLFPWISLGQENVEYILLDRYLHPYPLQPHEINAQIDDLIANTSYTIEIEADGLYLFHQGGEPLPAFSVDAVAGGTMLLSRAGVAVSDSSGVYRVVDRSPAHVQRGQTVRVSLYWEALDAPKADRTVSLRLVGPDGTFLAQHDNMPGQGKKPTSWWKKGWKIRDVYYLTIASDAPLGAGSLGVLVYDSFDSQNVPFDGDRQQVSLCDVQIVEAQP